MPEKKVSVTVGSSISVDPNSIQVKKAQDNVKWVNDAGIEFGIQIPGYPTPQCRMEGNKYVCVSGTFPNTGTVKYDVTSPGKPTLDPDLEIIP
jgi:hypothetical protein